MEGLKLVPELLTMHHASALGLMQPSLLRRVCPLYLSSRRPCRPALSTSGAASRYFLRPTPHPGSQVNCTALRLASDDCHSPMALRASIPYFTPRQFCTVATHGREGAGVTSQHEAAISGLVSLQLRAPQQRNTPRPFGDKKLLLCCYISTSRGLRDRITLILG
jgi:hypothetical protein